VNRPNIFDFSMLTPSACITTAGSPTGNAGLSLPFNVACSSNSIVSTSLRNESIKRVEQILMLKDGWDGYGGYAPSEAVCGHATQLINRLARNFPDLQSPDISPSSNGTLLLTWESKPGEAILEIGDLKFSGYVRRSGDLVPLSGEAQLLGETELSAIAGCLV
jgi:hypothetical protein